MLLEMFAITVVFFVVLFLWAAISFRRWKRNLLVVLSRNSCIADTSMGPIEYALRGEGPVILAIHGAPGGYDQGLLAMEKLTADGFSVLSISRPGYVRTPLKVGVTLEEQADAIAALMDSLNISKAAVLGASTGGAVALHFALRHPDRLWAQAIVAGVSQEYTMNAGKKRSLLRRIILSDSLMDIGVWLFDVATRRRPSSSLKEMFKENVDLEGKERDNYARQVMGFPDQVEWYKRFIQTTCPLSARNPGLENDIEQLARLSFDDLDCIRCPTLVIHGTADKEVPFSHAEFTATSIPNSVLLGFPNVGHIVWLGEHVELMESNLLDFFNEHVPS
ncbi:MAG: alpha/beta fold hydrolase [Candidatus Thorarchaeota archaeon]